MSSQQNGHTKGPDTWEYSESDFAHTTTTWAHGSQPELSKFDKAIYEQWDRAMANGVFRYNIDHIITRIIPGPRQYVAQLNTLRATERRKPQVITSVKQPFNSKAFNFTWVKDEEIIFNIRKLRGPISNGHIQNGHNACEKTEQNGAAANGIHHMETDDERHCLIVNVSPMEYGHCLLLPQVDRMMPQVLTQKAFEVAVETMLLTKHRGFRLGFNSLCAFASVNHLHFHAYYLNYELIVDHCPVGHLGGPYYEFTALPCPGFCVQLHGSTVEQLAKDAHRISSYFHEADIAHNVYINRGTVFGEDRNSNLTTVRLFIWPRKKYIGTKSSDEFNVACIELGGHLPIKDPFETINMACAELAGHENCKEEEGYHKFVEEDVDAIVDAANLEPELYQKLRQEVIRMGQEQAGEAANKESTEVVHANNDAGENTS